MKRIICFHNPDEINGYLSNWYLSDFCVDNMQYSSMEQYMMYQKALLFDDREIAGQIPDTTFQQNIELREKLLATQDHILAECAVQDQIWGIGLSMKDERRFNLSEWQGQNLLGFSLMRVRTVLSCADSH